MAAPSTSFSPSPPARRFLTAHAHHTPMPSKAPPPTPATTPPASRPSVPMLLPVFILFVLLLCFLSIFLLRDLLHFFSLWLRRRRLHAASVDAAIEMPTPMPRKPGLDPEILVTFLTMPFKAALKEPRAAEAECAVCLSEFADSDTVRLLTVCRHVFHAACIDSWLGAHTTCPVCRSDLSAPPDEATVIAIQEAIDGSQECD